MSSVGVRECNAQRAHQVVAVVAQLVVRAAGREPAAQLLRAHAPDVSVFRLVPAVVGASADAHVQIIVAAAAAAAAPRLRPAALAPGVHLGAPGAAKRRGARLKMPTLLADVAKAYNRAALLNLRAAEPATSPPTWGSDVRCANWLCLSPAR